MNGRRLAVGVVCVLLTWLVVTATSSRPVDAPLLGPAPTAHAAPAPTDEAGTGQDVHAPGIDEQQILDLSRRFATVWLTGRTAPRQEWLEGLRPLVSQRLLGGFALTDPGSLPPGDVLEVTMAGATPDGGTTRVVLTTGARYVVTVNTLATGRLAVVDIDLP